MKYTQEQKQNLKKIKNILDISRDYIEECIYRDDFHEEKENISKVHEILCCDIERVLQIIDKLK